MGMYRWDLPVTFHSVFLSMDSPERETHCSADAQFLRISFEGWLGGAGSVAAAVVVVVRGKSARALAERGVFTQSKFSLR